MTLLIITLSFLIGFITGLFTLASYLTKRETNHFIKISEQEIMCYSSILNKEVKQNIN
jgi:uncharacterized protein YneF (UPF0154 family)